MVEESGTVTRKASLKPKPSGKFIMHDFQEEDIATLLELDASANWSEMGAMKTSTAEWLWQEKLKHIPNPRVLVITTKSGKGTYYESLKEVLPDWDVFSVGPQKFNIVVGSKVVPVDVELPDPLYIKPVVVVAHYHCFTNRACHPKAIKGPNGLPIYDESTGTFVMDIPRCTQLMRMHWDMIILDEAHKIKNQDNQWSHNIKNLKSQYKHIMTGTGFVNNPAEVWSLLNFLYPKTYTSYWKFREAYCLEDDWSGYRKIVGIIPDKEDEFRQLVRRIGVRRTMLECFPDIDEPIETVVPVDLNNIQAKMYQEIMDDLYTYDQAGIPLHSPNVLSMLNRLRQICVATPKVTGDHYDPILDRRVIEVELVEPSSKLDATMEIIEGLPWGNSEKEQIVVFSNFKDPLKLLAKRLNEAVDSQGKPQPIPYLRLEADMNDIKRYELWHDIWPKKEHKVFLSTLALGSESINLSSSQRAIFLDQSWSPAMNKQAIGRVYRPGQTGVAQLIYVRAEKTVDYRILDANEEKHGWFKSIFGAWKGEVEEDD